MLKTFDFCANARVIKEVAPKEPEVIDLNGWAFHPKPNLPYQRSFMCKLFGLKWYLGNSGLILTHDVEYNAGRLLAFYREHRTYKPFLLNHEYLGAIECRFTQPIDIPEAESDSGGLIEMVEVEMVHHNPRYE